MREEIMQYFKEVDKHIYLSSLLAPNEAGSIEIGGKSIVYNDFHLYRYVPFPYLYSDLESGLLTFISPESWEDPFETIFYKKNKEIDDKKVIACLCFSYNRSNSEDGSWKAYGGCGEPIVKVAFKFDSLIKLLSSYAEKSVDNIDFYIGEVNYSLNKSEILELYKEEEGKCLSLDEYLSVLCCKRKAFMYESEIRIFVVGKTQEDSGNVYPCKGVRLKECITRVTLPPLRPYQDIRQKYYSKLQEIYNRGMYDYFAVFIKNREGEPDGRRLQQSRLYELNIKMK